MNRRIAILLSTPAFEKFFGAGFGLTPQQYAQTYRNDFSWYYASMFREHGLTPLIYVASYGTSEVYQTADEVTVRLLKLQPWYRITSALPVWRTALGRYGEQILNTLAFLPALERALRTDGVDVLYVQEYWSGRFDLLSGLLSKRISVVGSDHGGFRDRNVSAFKRLTFPRAAALTSQTRQEADEVRRHGGTASVLPNPIDTDHFAPAVRSRPAGASKRILTVARLENTQKRTSDLITAMTHLDRSWTLEIAGEGADRPLLERLVADLGLSERVRFRGFVGDRAMLRTLYHDCDVFCLPSAFEGLPMVVLEAMSCGRPVVATDIPAYRDLIERDVDAILVGARDPAALAAGILTAFDRSTVLGAAARRKIVQAHSQVSFMRRFEAEVLARCAGTPAAGSLQPATPAGS